MEKHIIIAISRQYGSGGKEIAEIVAKKMNVRCYDRQILYLAAEKMGETELDADTIIREAYQRPDFKLGSLGEYGFEAIPYYNKKFREQARVIREIAEKESAVFLGRCADAVLDGIQNHYSFFIYADEEFRRQRAQTHYEHKTLKDMEREDKTRERYYNYYTGKKWGDPLNYDLMINTSKINLNEAAELIIDYIDKKTSKEEKINEGERKI
ncbi:AAA family ATPase [Blautia sp.]|uniref:cytidylate kinase-like family protein n=1 Tax=Blautia sp. TaxID=1955243 RepID=UPI003AB4DAF3